MADAPIRFAGRIIGDQALVEHFSYAGGRLREELRGAIRSVGEQSRARSAALAPRLHGRLQETMRLRLSETNRSIKAEVFPGVGYGYILSLGVNKDVKNPHGFRKVKSSDIVGVRLRKTKSGTVIASPVRRRKVEIRDARHKATKRLHILPRRFFDTALDELRPTIDAEIDAAIDRATKGA